MVRVGEFLLVVLALGGCSAPEGAGAGQDPIGAPPGVPGATGAPGDAVSPLASDAGVVVTDAAATGSSMYVEMCDKTYTSGSGGMQFQYWYAEHKFGSMREGALVRCLMPWASVPGYTQLVVEGTQVRPDGMTACQCEGKLVTSDAGRSVTQVTFVAP